MGPENDDLEDKTITPTDDTSDADRGSDTSKDDQTTGGGDDGSEDEVDYSAKDQNKSVKDSLRNALKQVAEKEEDASDKEDKPSKNKQTNDDTINALKGEKDTKSKEPKVVNTEKVPTSWNENAKKHWGSLPKDVVEATIKREKEISDGFAIIENRKQDLERLTELDTVLAPRLEAIKRYGARPAQVIDRLFSWMEALSDPAKKDKTIRDLARNYGINLSVAEPTNADDTNADQNQNTDQVQIEAHPAFQQLKNQFDTFVQQQEAQKVETAAKSVNDWAKDKPHFQKVRTVIAGLLQSGAIPLKPDGSLDLDKAYQSACYADPEIRDILAKETKEKEDNAKKEAAAETEKKRLAKLNKAKQANLSIKPSAPTAAAKSGSTGKLNGKVPSARDSIREAMAQLSSD